jgi:hypothetical protein
MRFIGPAPSSEAVLVVKALHATEAPPSIVVADASEPAEPRLLAPRPER